MKATIKELRQVVRETLIAEASKKSKQVPKAVSRIKRLGNKKIFSKEEMRDLQIYKRWLRHKPLSKKDYD